MHVHIVLMKLKDPTTLDHCCALVESMRGRIPDMIDLDVQVNNHDGSYSCDFSLTTTWPDLDAYERYAVDPVHLEVRVQILDLIADAMTLDYSTLPAGDTR